MARRQNGAPFSDRTPETFYGACHYLFTELIKKYLGKQIVIMTPLHRTGELLPSREKPVEDGLVLKDYVNAVREVAEYYALPVLDLFATSALQPDIPEIKEYYMPDGLHPNDNGHAVIANKLKKFLENM